MPTTLPRVHVTFEKPIYNALRELAKSQNLHLSAFIHKLVVSALSLAEDLAFVDIAEERLKTFRRDDAISSQDLLQWNRNRAKRK